MYSSSLSPLPSSPAPPPFPTSNNSHTEYTEARLRTSIWMVDNLHPMEHHVTRYAIFFIINYFPLEIWNIVPQYYTYSGKIPDIVLETFVRRPGRERDSIFVPRVYIEFKTEVNTKDAIKQLIESISFEHGANLKSKGFLIGVKGTKWTIMDYQLVITQGNKDPECFFLNFYDSKGDETVQSRRPTPSRQLKDFDFMDLKSEDDSSDLCKALDWIGKQNEPKDLTNLRHHASHLPVSLSTSTIRSLCGGSEEPIEWLQNEYAYLIPLFRGNYMKMDD